MNGRPPMPPFHGATDTCANCESVFTLTPYQRSDIRRGVIREKFCGAPCQLRHNQTMRSAQIGRDSAAKISASRLALFADSATWYPKVMGVHEHRTVAEAKLGRKLRPGEIVHHKDHTKRNNDPDNIEVPASQSEHCKVHNFGKTHD